MEKETDDSSSMVDQYTIFNWKVLMNLDGKRNLSLYMQRFLIFVVVFGVADFGLFSFHQTGKRF